MRRERVGIRRIVSLGGGRMNLTQETLNPDIEPRIGISLMQVSGDFSLVGD
jgi:hypothetical protein